MSQDENASPRPPLHILYADDMRELREVARIMLGREGHVIECVGDGREALARVTADPAGYDLVMTDHHMPQMNGVELVLQLRQTHFPGRILVFSSELSSAAYETYQKLGVDGILYKPVLPAQLRQTIADMFHIAPPVR